MNHVVSFLRPGQTDVLAKVTVPPHEDAAAYIRRLEHLGYKVVGIVPPIDHQGPPQKPLPPGLRVVNQEGSSLSSDATPPFR